MNKKLAKSICCVVPIASYRRAARKRLCERKSKKNLLQDMVMELSCRGDNLENGKIEVSTLHNEIKKIDGYKWKFVGKSNELKYLLNNCDIHQDPIALINNGVFFPHPIGIVMSGQSKISKNCIISQNVTIGNKDGKEPTLEENCKIMANSVIFGDITIGENSIIAPNSVVF
jgi:acetyltransferase-like isoleucine patch superfamily enzyme